MEWVILSVVIIGAVSLLFRVALKRPVEVDTAEQLAPEERSIHRRLSRRQREVEAAADSVSEGAFAPIAQQALTSSREIVSTLTAALGQRQSVRQALLNRSMFEREIARLKREIEAATTEETRQALTAAIRAKSMELGHFESLEAALKRIDAILLEAEASLTEMRARLLSVRGQAGEGLDLEGLKSNLSQMEALRNSVDEVKVVLA